MAGAHPAGDFTYTDHVNFMGATGAFAFLRVAWGDHHPYTCHNEQLWAELAF